MLVVAAGFGTALVVWTTGGGTLALGVVTLSVRSAARPALAGAVAAVLLAIAIVTTAEMLERRQRAVGAAVAIGFLTLLWAAAGVTLHAVSAACGGLDSYAYMSTARLLLAGRLSQPEPLAASLPFENGLDALAPLGYQPSPARTVIVPTFPIGFPLAVAAVAGVGGEGVAFYTPFLLGAGAVALTYLLAKRFMPAPAAALAAVLAAVDPVFTNEAIQPMSDVPATFWVLAAAYLVARRRALPTGAGIAAGLAVLTRPPLLLPALLVPWIARSPTRRELPRYFGALAAVVAALVVVQARLYGSPFVSGHGSAGQLFTASVVAVNGWHHFTWLTVVHTPLLFVALACALAWSDRRFAACAVAIFAAVGAPYLLYSGLFNDWEMLRFLLPGLVFLLIAAAGGLHAAAERLGGSAIAAPLILAVALVAAVWGYTFASRHGVFGVKEFEAKYPRVASWIDSNTPADAVVLASLHSGSIRFYAGRTTMRFDAVPGAALAPTVRALRDLGRRTYVALDGPDERNAFRARFSERELRDVAVYPEGRVGDVDLFRIEPRAR